MHTRGTAALLASTRGRPTTRLKETGGARAGSAILEGLIVASARLHATTEVVNVALHLLDGRLQKGYNTHQDGLLVGLVTLIDGTQATRGTTYGHLRRGRERIDRVHQVGFVAVRRRSQWHEVLTWVWSRSGSNGARGSVSTSEGLRQSMLKGKTVLVEQVIVTIAVRTTRAITLHFAQQSDASWRDTRIT
jgi:hypothetical protein